MPTIREGLSERRCRSLGSSGASRSCSLQEPQIERREHQDNPDVYHQALPEPMPEDQDVHADHDGYQREHVKHDACLPSHRSTLLLEDRVAAMDDAAGRQHVERFQHNVIGEIAPDPRQIAAAESFVGRACDRSVLG
jgi:hypothetical protein